MNSHSKLAIDPVDKLLETFLKCPICHENVGNEPKTQRMCGHSMCHNCYMLNSAHLEVMVCPICRSRSFVGTDTARYGRVTREALPVNVMIKDVVKFVEDNKDQMRKTACNCCGVKDEPVVCVKCSDMKVTAAVRKARPKYRYEYDDTPVYEKIEKEIARSRKKIKLSSGIGQQIEEVKQGEECAEVEEKAKEGKGECKIM